MLEAHVQVLRHAKLLEVVEVRVVDVPVHPEQPLEDRAKYHLFEVGRVGAGAALDREDALVVQLLLDPLHQVVYVAHGAHLGRLLVLDAVGPKVLELRACVHDGAGALVAQLVPQNV